jgi:3-hydroxyacyl-[acyl-carrier-protein] dehydratase
MTLATPRAVLEHRDPFLFIDTAVDWSETSAKCDGTFIAEHIVFKGHFPSGPIVPGVLLVEAMAQTLAWWALSSPAAMGAQVLLTGIDKARFRRAVLPNERVHYRVDITREILGEIHANATAHVGVELAAKAVIKAMVKPAS